MLAIKHVVGIQSVEVKKDNGVRKGTTIYFNEPFPDDAENIVGMKSGQLFTYKNVDLKVGDTFQALYDLEQKWNSEKRVMEPCPVLAELRKVDTKFNPNEK